MSNHNNTINAWSAHLAEQVPSCPCPPETSDTALSSTDDVDGGIFSSSLKSIADQLLIIKSSCTVFNLANFSDEERYLLLEIELRIQELITGQKIICDSENLS